MKKNKILLLIISIILFSGCSAKVNLIVDTNKNLIEKASVSIDRKFLENMYSSTDEIDKYYTNLLGQYNDKFKLDIKTKNDLVVGNLKKSSGKLNKLDGIEKVLVKEVSSNYDSYTIVLSDELKNYFSPNLEIDVESEGLLEDLTINIQFFNGVSSSNADYFNNSTNTYTWTFNKNNFDKTIEFSLTDSKRYDIIIPYFIINNIALIFLIIFVIILIIGGIFIAYKSSKENQI